VPAAPDCRTPGEPDKCILLELIGGKVKNWVARADNDSDESKWNEAIQEKRLA
jgi:hypothetical protein